MESNLALGGIVHLVRAFRLYRVCATSSSSRACMPFTTLSDNLHLEKEVVRY